MTNTQWFALAILFSPFIGVGGLFLIFLIIKAKLKEKNT